MKQEDLGRGHRNIPAPLKLGVAGAWAFLKIPAHSSGKPVPRCQSWLVGFNFIISCTCLRASPDTEQPISREVRLCYLLKLCNLQAFAKEGRFAILGSSYLSAAAPGRGQRSQDIRPAHSPGAGLCCSGRNWKCDSQWCCQRQNSRHEQHLPYLVIDKRILH